MQTDTRKILCVGSCFHAGIALSCLREAITLTQTIPRAAWNLHHPFSAGRTYEVYHLTNHHVTTPEFHSHDFYELYFFLSGHTSIVIEEYTYLMHPGDVVIIPPGCMHRAVQHARQSYYDRFFIYVTRDMLRRVSTAEYPIARYLDEAVAQARLHAHPPDDAFSRALLQLQDVIVSAPGADALGRLNNDCAITMVLAQLCRWFSTQGEAGVSHTPHALADVIAYVNAHLTEDVSLDALAERFYVNKYHLLRSFKAYAQVTLYQYILQKRINRAKDFLRADTPPAQVCAQCGFHDYSSFYKAFKKHTGMSPQQYAAFTHAPERRI